MSLTKHTTIKAAGIAWKVIEDDRLPPRHYIVGGQVFRFTEVGTMEPTEMEVPS